MIRPSVSGLATGSGLIGQQQAAAGPNQRYFQDLDRGLQGSNGQRYIGVGVRRGPGVRTAGAAGLGAGPKCLFDNGFDGARAAAAFGATAEAAIDLLGASGEVFC